MKNRFANALVRTVANVPLKIKISFGLLVFAMLMAIIKARIDATWCLIAVFFCFAGDIALNYKKDRSKRTNQDFIIGMLMFAIAHVLYAVVYFLRILNEYPEVLELGINWTLFLVVDSVLILGFFSVMNENLRLGKYDIAIFVYTIVIMTSFSMTFFFANCAQSVESLACIGATLLIVSDSVIAVEKFSHYETRDTRVIVWITYVLGQLLMITFA